ncbi:MAG: DUF4286 family protein [Chitinophagaceae bacterium]|nr:DUF4286 family protein [Chitinophagaceae bacterium]
MVVYNITTKVTWQIADEWLKWQQEEHIPEMLATLLFAEHKIFKLLEQHEDEGPTFTIQFFFSSLGKYEAYMRLHAAALREKAINRWGNQSISFRTVMQLVN